MNTVFTYTQPDEPMRVTASQQLLNELDKALRSYPKGARIPWIVVNPEMYEALTSTDRLVREELPPIRISPKLLEARNTAAGSADRAQEDLVIEKYRIELAPDAPQAIRIFKSSIDPGCHFWIPQPQKRCPLLASF